MNSFFFWKSGIVFFCLFPFFSVALSAEPFWENAPEETLIFKHELQSFSLPLAKHPEFFSSFVPEEQHSPQETCPWPQDENEKDENVSLSSGVVLNEEEWRHFFEDFLASEINTPRESVRIFRGENQEILFEGAAKDGKTVDIDQLLALSKKALQDGVFEIEIPVFREKASVVIEDEELIALGIEELLAVGDSNFSGSTANRVHNIEAGVDRFQGILVGPGEIFSFNDHLGPVNAQTGYLPELVITGQKLSKEYGGGLCQVSSTTFRAALLAGLPIVERHNHSFAVNYYQPWGTDATIYLGGKDFRFLNDTPGSLLIQTVLNRKEAQLSFHLYGTNDNRKTRFFAPSLSRHLSPLPTKIETSEKLAPGEKVALSHAVAGFDALLTRMVFASASLSPKVDQFFSRYQPRANWTLVGSSPSDS